MPLPFLSAATLMSVVIVTPVLWRSGCGDPRPSLPESLEATFCVIRGTGGLQESFAAPEITRTPWLKGAGLILKHGALSALLRQRGVGKMINPSSQGKCPQTEISGLTIQLLTPLFSCPQPRCAQRQTPPSEAFSGAGSSQVSRVPRAALCGPPALPASFHQLLPLLVEGLVPPGPLLSGPLSALPPACFCLCPWRNLPAMRLG